MAWTVTGNIRGPRGLDGAPGSPGANGISVASAAKDAGGNLILTLSNGQTLNAGNVVGAPGRDGTSVTIVGSVANAAALPTGFTPSDAGKGYIANDTGNLHVWSGTAWTNAGQIKGPKGDKGDPGNQGVRGSQWLTGTGAPSGANAAGAIAGDKYMDLATGDVYNFS